MKKIYVLIAVLAMVLNGCGENVVSSSITPKQIIDSEQRLIGYIVTGELTETAVPEMFFVFQNGEAIAYRGGVETLSGLSGLSDDEIVELLQDRESYNGTTSVTVYKDVLSSKPIYESVNFCISYGVRGTELNWLLDTNDTRYCENPAKIKGNKYYGYSLLVENETEESYLCIRTDAENFTLGFDTAKTDGVIVENMGGL